MVTGLWEGLKAYAGDGPVSKNSLEKPFEAAALNYQHEQERQEENRSRNAQNEENKRNFRENFNRLPKEKQDEIRFELLKRQIDQN